MKKLSSIEGIESICNIRSNNNLFISTSIVFKVEGKYYRKKIFNRGMRKNKNLCAYINFNKVKYSIIELSILP